MNGYVDDGVHVVDTFFMFSYRLNFESHSLLTSLIYFYFVSLRLCLSSFARCLLFLNGYLAHIERCCFLFRFCLCFYYEVIMSVSMWLCVNEMKKKQRLWWHIARIFCNNFLACLLLLARLNNWMDFFSFKVDYRLSTVNIFIYSHELVEWVAA